MQFLHSLCRLSDVRQASGCCHHLVLPGVGGRPHPARGARTSLAAHGARGRCRPGAVPRCACAAAQRARERLQGSCGRPAPICAHASCREDIESPDAAWGTTFQEDRATDASCALRTRHNMQATCDSQWCTVCVFESWPWLQSLPHAGHDVALAKRDRPSTSVGSSARLDGCGALATARDAQPIQSGGGGGTPSSKRRGRPSSPYSSFRATTSAARRCACGCAVGPTRSASRPRGARWTQARRSATGTTACDAMVSTSSLQLIDILVGRRIITACLVTVNALWSMAHDGSGRGNSRS